MDELFRNEVTAESLFSSTSTEEDRRRKEEERLARERSLEPSRLSTLAMGTAAGSAGARIGTYTPEEPFVKKYWKDEEGNLLGEDEASAELKLQSPSSVVIEKPSENISRMESQKAIKDFFTNKESATGGDWIDLESPMATMVRGQQEALNRAKEPTALQRKFEEMGLEYDYSKRAETGTVRKEDLDAEIEQENPAFVQRNRDYDKVVSLRDQLDEQYQFKKGQLEAIELGIFANRDYASSELGRNRMAMIRQEQAQLDALYQAEDAKLDGNFYNGLPEKDMEVANVLLNQGVTGKRMSSYTANHGNIRDTFNELILNVPEDKKEEFQRRILGDVKRDDQGNIVRNALGEELRNGSEIVSVTPYGTYDFKISPKAYQNQINKLVNEYVPQGEDFDKVLRQKETQISRLEAAADTTEDEAASERYTATAEKLKREVADFTMASLGEQPFINESEQMEESEKVAEAETKTMVAEETTADKAEASSLFEGPEEKIQKLIDSNLANYDDAGNLISLSDNPQVIAAISKLKDEVRKKKK
jgi:hypothetical protein